jgi:transposase
LSDSEWEHIACYLAALNCGLSFEPRRRGRPPENVRARLDAIFRAVTLKHPKGGRANWNQLPAEFGKPDTVSKTYRRWLGRGLWQRLLSEVADPTCPTVLRDLSYYICCAFRRGWRLLPLPALLLAKQVGLWSALPGPPFCLPLPGLTAELVREGPRLVAEVVRNWRRIDWRWTLRTLKMLHKVAAGVPLNRYLEPD